MIDIERLKVDPDYWDEVVDQSVVAVQQLGLGLHPRLFTKIGVDCFMEQGGSESQLIYRPHRSTASLLTDEQAEARMADDCCIDEMGIANFQKECERKADEVKKAFKASGLVSNDVAKRKASELHDPVNSPSHYASGGIECIDAMQAMLSRDEFIGYLRGNIFKYQWRYKLKNGVEDLKKAQWYQNKLIEVESK